MALTLDDFKRAASALDVPLAAIRAFAEVESNGSGFIDGKRPKVQYEPHIMFKRLTANKNYAVAQAAAKKWPDLVSTKMGSYQSLNAEDRDMDRAAQLIDRTSALESASWGQFQVMGFHWAACKFDSLQQFVNAQYSDTGQLDTLVRFLQSEPEIVKAILDKDWREVARRYNGPAYAKNAYHTKLRNAYAKFGGK